MLYPLLFKRTSTGAVQTWQREVEGSRYRSISGQIDGAKVTSGWTQAEAKNVGKSNETDPEEQAHLECEAEYEKKLNQGGYHQKLEDIDTPKFFKPMTAKNYEDFPVTSWVNVFSQPKLDGVRCIATIDGLWSRQGKPLISTPHIAEQLKKFFEANPDAVLDGELYADKLVHDFQKILSLARKAKPTDKDKAEAAELIEFHLYDYPSVGGMFYERYVALADLFEADMFGPAIKLVDTVRVENQEELDGLNGRYLSQGYEGQMIRQGPKPYENKRTKSLLKRKEFTDREFIVEGIYEGKGNRSGMAGFITYYLEGDSGTTFNSGIKGSHAYCKQLLKDADKYVGASGTVKFFRLTDDGIPYLPVTIALYPEGRDV